MFDYDSILSLLCYQAAKQEYGFLRPVSCSLVGCDTVVMQIVAKVLEKHTASSFRVQQPRQPQLTYWYLPP
jgi:hypothetical protein